MLERQVVVHALREAANALGAIGIACAPIKSALLLAGSDRFTRSFADIDILVAPDDHARARRCLEGLGYVAFGVQPFATCFAHPIRPLPLDLHGECFPAGLFDLPARDVLRRATDGSTTLGAPVLRLDGRDAYALTVGHFVKDRKDVRQAAHLTDLAIIAETFGLDAKTVASHLERHGLRRAAHHTLAIAASLGDTFAADVRRRLPETPTDRAARHLATRWIAALPSASALAAPAAHVLNRSLASGARSLTRHAGEAVVRRTRNALRWTIPPSETPR